MGTSWAMSNMSLKCRRNLVTSYYNTVDTIELVHHQIVNSQEFDSSVPSSWAGLDSHITTVDCFCLRQPALKIVLPVTTLCPPPES